MNVRAAWATDAALQNLRSWWDLGVSTTEIGVRLQTSKNAIVGKAHRLNLAPRPSPIDRSRVVMLPPLVSTLPPIVSTLPPLVSESAAAPAPPPADAPPEDAQPVYAPSADAQPADVPHADVPPVYAPSADAQPEDAPRQEIIAPAPPIAPSRRVGPCCWVTGVTKEGSRRPAWLHCESDSVPNRPYCQVHEQRVARQLNAGGGH
jgi:GcrA cell cycle regulator